MSGGLAIPTPDVREQAERWFARLGAPDCTEEDTQAFERWRIASPAHAAAYHDVENTFQVSRQLLQDPALALLREEALRPRRASMIWRSTVVAWATAAALVIAVGLGFVALLQIAKPAQHYATAVGEQRTLELADHSRVLLDTDSALAVRYGWRQRHTLLERGRAQFTVTPDTRKPFLVETVHGTVRVLGTSFQVQVTDEAATTLLLEGVVEVTAPPSPGSGSSRVETLEPGEELTFDATGESWTKRQIDVEAASGWIRGELILDEWPLGELLEEANRYATLKLRLGDPSLADIPISGVFHAGDQQALVLALQHGWGLHAKRVSDNEILLSRQPQ